MRVNTLLSFMDEADRLVESAGESVISFFLSKEMCNTPGPGFTGFLRDSLIRDRPHLLTTGGGAVVNDLYKVGSYFPYLKTTKRPLIEKLSMMADRSRRYVMENASDTIIARSPSFQTLSPLTYSVYSSIANRGPNSSEKAKRKSTLFNAVNLRNFLASGWPSYKDVENAHPFVAYKVQGSAISLTKKDDDSLKEMFEIISKGKLKNILKLRSPNIEDITFFEELGKIEASFADLKSLSELEEQIASSHAAYCKNAQHYLLEQDSYAPDGVCTSSEPLRYDPVGACFALQVLLLAHRKDNGEYDLHKFLGNYGSLVSRSIKHILESLTHTGSFPYGSPFSYKPNGTAGFTTSTNGLSTLAHFILKLLYSARRSNYPSRKFFERLLIDNESNFERFFSMLSMFITSRRTATIPTSQLDFLKKPLQLTGWSTDRAFSSSRIESWVTIEVFLFALYMREALQEYAQLLVSGKYRATLPATEPAWPYVGTKRICYTTPDPGTTVLLDPDAKVSFDHVGPIGLSPSDIEKSPVQFLHQNFSGMMETIPEIERGWSQRISSVLLYGPPGTAKTTTVKSLAQHLKWQYLEISPSDFIIDGLGGIEQKAKDLFEDLSSLRETVILFDELDSLFVDRSLLKPESMINFVVPAMLPKLQSLSRRAKNQRLLIVIATNFYDKLDPAMVRLGRIDKHFLVLPYNDVSRLDALKGVLPERAGLFASAKEKKALQDATRLYVFEEIKAVAHQLGAKLPSSFNFPASSISPSLYAFRIPKPNDDQKPLAGILRLALEVCEIAGRLHGENRRLTPDDGKAKIIKSLQAKVADLPTPLYAEWVEVCNKLIEVLKTI